MGEIKVGDINCDSITNEDDEALADLNRDGMVNFLDDHNRDGIIDSIDEELGGAVALAAHVASKELDKGGSYSQAKAKALEAVRERGVYPKRASKSARTGTVNAVGDKVSDGVSRDLVKERIIRFSLPREIGLGDTEHVEAVILSKYSQSLQQESAVPSPSPCGEPVS